MWRAWLSVALIAVSAAAVAQAPQPSSPATGSLAAPGAPPAAPPAPQSPAPQPPAPQPPAAQADQQPPGTTPQTSEQATPSVGGPTDIVLEARPVLLLRGQSTWDEGFDTLMEAFGKLAAEAKRLRLDTVGRPQAAFTSTDDFGFKFEAMLTLSAAPSSPPPGVGRDFVLAQSPAGKALLFTHTGAYDDIDTTYEAITAYLDEKGLKARNIFVEEYVNNPKDSEDASLEMNIFVLLE